MMNLFSREPTKEKGGKLGSRRQEDVSNMLHKLNMLPEQSCNFITEGFRTLTADQMSLVLDECQFVGQRDIVKNQVTVLSDLMRRNQWRPKDKLDFARIGGSLILVNGYHRAHAQVATGRTIEWTIAIYDCATMDEVRSLYYTFDTNNQIRGARQVLNGMEFAAGTPLGKDFRIALFNAVPFIAAGFRTGRDSRDLLVTRVMDRRLDLANQFLDAALLYQNAVKFAPSAVKRKMRNGGCCAVALVTLKFQPDRAYEFWAGAATNDGLRRGDPRHTLISDFLTRNMNSGAMHQSMAAPAIAWNAFYQNRSLKIIKVYDSEVISIAGTPFNGKA